MKTIIIIIIAIISITLTTTNAQTTFTSPEIIEIDGIEELFVGVNIPNVVFKSTTSKRILVIKKITVSHPTKEEAVINFIQKSKSYELDKTFDFVHHSLRLNKKAIKNHLIVDNKIVEVVETYEIYVPKTVTLHRG